MAKNKLEHLNDHLFAQLERLGNEEMTAEELKIEMDRSKAISSVAKEIISNANLTLEATKFKVNELPSNKELPNYLDTNKQ